MTSGAIGSKQNSGIADLLSALVIADGSARHRFILDLTASTGGEAARSLADAVHHLSTLYGRHPGVADLLAERGMHPEISDWIAAAVNGFADERSYLTRVVVAAGPIPSTPGQAESEAATLGQRHAIEMLARSDRNGCALGATLALALDWPAIRGLIDITARRFGIEPPVLQVPANDATLLAAVTAATSIGTERAIAFGAQQILVQHRGLWDLLEARRVARRSA